MVARDQAPIAVPEYVGHCGQREDVGRILRRTAQQPSAALRVPAALRLQRAFPNNLEAEKLEAEKLQARELRLKTNLARNCHVCCLSATASH